MIPVAEQVRLWVGHNPDPWTCSICGEPVDGVPPESDSGLACELCREQSPGIKGDPFIPLTIAPRRSRTKPDRRMLVAQVDDQWLTEHGELLTDDQVVELLRPRTLADNRAGHWHEQWAPAIIITNDSTSLFGWADEQFAGHPFWNWQVKLLPHTPSPANLDKLADFDRAREVPARFGWSSVRGKKGTPGYRRSPEGRARWFDILSPQDFSGAVRRLVEPTLEGLLEFGLALRAFCEQEGLRVSTSASALANQYLRDGRFWPDRRRKMPAADNARVRDHLPGNHYRLLAEPMVNHPTARKIDVTGSHHQIAIRTQFPLVDTFWAQGQFKDPPEAGADPAEVDTPYMTDPDYAAHGMFCVALWTAGELADDPLALPCFRDAGWRVRYVFSNELPTIHAERAAGRAHLAGCYAQWTSPDVDDGLNEYAWHALETMQRLERGTVLREWTKQMFHSVYGQLAARPRHHGSIWQGPPGEPWQAERWVQTDYGEAQGHLVKTKKAREAPTACVIWRAMIEAGQRVETLRKARELRDSDATVLLVHSDSIFYTGGDADAGWGVWRDEGELTNIMFYSSTQYQSDQEDKLPGTSRALERAARRRAAIAAGQDPARLAAARRFASGPPVEPRAVDLTTPW